MEVILIEKRKLGNIYHVIILILIITSISLIMVNFSEENFELEAVELTEYQGKSLSSIYDFRENSIKGPQYVSRERYKLTITGLVNNSYDMTYDEIISFFNSSKRVITLFCVEGWDVKILWEGIIVKDLLDIANVLPEANTIIFKAYDGYSTSFPIKYITENNIIMAFKMNNVTIPPERGFPFQLVAESKWGYKWIKWITTIELSDNPEYRGYWESRGYSNSGDLDKGFFE
ncbi:MAG: oxidoreductase [Thermoplasmatales archaeon SG8-52-3]|jgi:DMSO/TMAO reductase YedYZ molybdopterin-dependent catalytic subunit|nr:MAG: oxidoreductase [Thermoplasmatales archaeon SG8-52-3]